MDGILLLGSSFVGAENISSFSTLLVKNRRQQKADQLYDGKGVEKVERINLVEIRLLGKGKLEEKTKERKKSEVKKKVVNCFYYPIKPSVFFLIYTPKATELKSL